LLDSRRRSGVAQLRAPNARADRSSGSGGAGAAPRPAVESSGVSTDRLPALGQEVFQRLLDPVLVTDPAGASVVDANPAACQLFGLTLEELLAVDCLALRDPDDELRWAVAVAERARTGSFRGELSWRRADGTTFPAVVGCALFEVDGRELSAIAVRDIGDRVALERNLVTALADMERLATVKWGGLKAAAEGFPAPAVDTLIRDLQHVALRLRVHLDDLVDVQARERVRRILLSFDRTIHDLQRVAIATRQPAPESVLRTVATPQDIAKAVELTHDLRDRLLRNAQVLHHAATDIRRVLEQQEASPEGALHPDYRLVTERLRIIADAALAFVTAAEAPGASE